MVQDLYGISAILLCVDGRMTTSPRPDIAHSADVLFFYDDRFLSLLLALVMCEIYCSARSQLMYIVKA